MAEVLSVATIVEAYSHDHLYYSKFLIQHHKNLLFFSWDSSRLAWLTATFSFGVGLCCWENFFHCFPASHSSWIDIAYHCIFFTVFDDRRITPVVHPGVLLMIFLFFFSGYWLCQRWRHLLEVDFVLSAWQLINFLVTDLLSGWGSPHPLDSQIH